MFTVHDNLSVKMSTYMAPLEQIHWSDCNEYACLKSHVLDQNLTAAWQCLLQFIRKVAPQGWCQRTKTVWTETQNACVWQNNVCWSQSGGNSNRVNWDKTNAPLFCSLALHGLNTVCVVQNIRSFTKCDFILYPNTIKNHCHWKHKTTFITVDIAADKKQNGNNRRHTSTQVIQLYTDITW